jgi:hypothetical protein
VVQAVFFLHDELAPGQVSRIAQSARNAVIAGKRRQRMLSAHQWKSKFQELIDDICRELGWPPPSVDDTNALTSLSVVVNGVDVDITHSAIAHPEQFLVKFKLGPVPQHGSADLFKKLLRSNQALSRMGGGTLAMEGEGRINYLRAQPLMQVLVEVLMDELEMLTLQVKELQTLFLSDC